MIEGIIRGDKIVAHEDWQGMPWLAFVAHCYRQFGHSGMLPPLTDVHGTMVASVNHGRWLVECPSGDGCAMVVSPSQPYFMCVVCGNEANGGRWYNVQFPGAPEKRAIEGALLKRPIRNRNWEPGETAQALEAENIEHGVT